MATLKLTDIQCVILSAAGASDSGLVLPLPKSLRVNRGTQTIVLKGLLKKDLIAVRAAQPDEEIWETAEDGTRTALTITNAGLEAIGITPTSAGTPEVAPARGRMKGAAAGRGGSDPNPKPAPASKNATDTPPAEPGKDTKLGILITALRRKKGATTADLVEATGWQAHSVRSAISGALKKKLQLEVVSEATDGRGRVYRISGQTA
ncbi:MAG TPA: DUF3489 domain-containing protein [Devosia sp.]|nr:DUF3489 domain-containing protein [Devosia sp.]